VVSSCGGWTVIQTNKIIEICERGKKKKELKKERREEKRR
jgi:hypothetical protein